MSASAPLRPLLNQHALVTGGGTGIGRSIALALGDAGARVTLVGRREEKLQAVATELRDRGCEAVCQAADVCQLQGLSEAFSKAVAAFGPVDVLVNNAGLAGESAPFAEVDVAAWWRVFEVNLLGVMHACQCVLKSMRDRGRGRIINIGSNAAFLKFPGAETLDSAYAASKAALMRFSELLAAASRESGIAIFTMSPGLVLTDMTREWIEADFFSPEDCSPPEMAARMCCRLAAGEADVLSGRYLHAVSDDLDTLLSHARKIEDEDLLTLRLRPLDRD
jgi:NAD(P)-dependent dehydrogenase (short-subunit alcohol dehydrogenase family)